MNAMQLSMRLILISKSKVKPSSHELEILYSMSGNCFDKEKN